MFTIFFSEGTIVQILILDSAGDMYISMDV